MAEKRGQACMVVNFKLIYSSICNFEDSLGS